MRFRINHTTTYEYDGPVTLNPTILHLTPRHDSYQKVVSHSLNISPNPAGLSSYFDVCGNGTHTAWFVGETRELTIKASMEIETLQEDPFNYIITDSSALAAPIEYDPQTSDLLKPDIRPSENPQCNALIELVYEILRLSNKETLKFLSFFCTRLSMDIKHEIRETGNPLSPAETLSKGKGACRDTAIVFIEGCRMVGLAARFVSGYKCLLDNTRDDQYMHAWAEVYLPGAGWRAYDPSIGLAVSDYHIALASAPIYNITAPVSGTYRTLVPGTNSHMKVRINLEKLDIHGSNSPWKNLTTQNQEVLIK